MTDRYVVCAAVRYGDVVVCGARHFDRAMCSVLAQIDTAVPQSLGEQGFIDQHGTFLTREKALEIALAAGQINTRRPKTRPHHQLFSEDLY